MYGILHETIEHSWVTQFPLGGLRQNLLQELVQRGLPNPQFPGGLRCLLGEIMRGAQRHQLNGEGRELGRCGCLIERFD